MVVLVVLSGAACSAPAPSRPPGAVDVYVDCAASVPDPDGSMARPYTTLSQVNALEFGPGDRLLFRRGSACRGMLAPRGSGTVADPWVIDDYGTATARARIDGAGADNAILLLNVQGVVVRDLELTNNGSPGVDRRGLQVLLDNYGAGRYYLIQNLHVHDVVGSPQMGPGASDGILFSIVGGTRPSWFEGVLVERNVVGNVDYGGIRVGPSVWHERPENGHTTITMPWTPHRLVVVRRNLVSSVGGDGIVVDNTAGARVEENIVADFHLEPEGYYVGIWTISSDDTVIQRNYVTRGRTRSDGFAFDSDIGSLRTVIQYNYSADNAGGFVLLCSGRDDSRAVVRDVIVRYNVSQNDGYRGVGLCHGRIESSTVHNNVIYAGPGQSMLVIEDNNLNPHDVDFVNNIVLKEGSGLAVILLAPGAQTTLRSSLFLNVFGAPLTMIRDPLLVDPGAATGFFDLGGYQLRAGSPGLGAAAPVPGNGGRDIFGNPVAAGGPANIGAYEGAGIP